MTTATVSVTAITTQAQADLDRDLTALQQGPLPVDAETDPEPKPILADCKAGDFLAYVTHGGWSSRSTAVKVPVIKRNKASLVFVHEGIQQKVRLDGGHMYGHHVEPWDDAKEEKRARDFELFNAERAYQVEDMPTRLLPRGDDCPSPEDIVANPELWAQIKIIRERAMAETAEVCAKMRRLRICREAAAGITTHYGPGAIVHDGPIDGCLDCAHLECP